MQLLYYKTAAQPPRGKGRVVAYSATAGRWMQVNWKYVRRNPDVYPLWRPSEEYRWTRSAVSRSSE